MPAPSMQAPATPAIAIAPNSSGTTGPLNGSAEHGLEEFSGGGQGLASNFGEDDGDEETDREDDGCTPTEGKPGDRGDDKSSDNEGSEELPEGGGTAHGCSASATLQVRAAIIKKLLCGFDWWVGVAPQLGPIACPD
jgi:hypothetical protein